MKMTYYITATFVRDGQRQTCNTEEVLGFALKERYSSQKAGLAALQTLRSSISQYGLDHSVKYELEVCS